MIKNHRIMNTYSQAKINGNAMPFIMGCTRPSPIEAMEDDEKVIYDPMTQSTVVNMRTVGTRSLKQSGTRIPPKRPGVAATS